MSRVVISLQDLGKREFRLSRQARKAAQAESMRACADEVRELLTAKSQPIFDRGLFRAGWRTEVKVKSIVVRNIVLHAKFVENGRRAGARMPPLKAIREWLIRRGANPGLAFPVARAIAIRGIRARSILFPSMAEMDAIVGKHFSLLAQKVNK